MKNSGKKLSDEDRILWARVARSARPLKGREAELVSAPEGSTAADLEMLLGEPQKSPPPPDTRPAPERVERIYPLDPPTKIKLSKGRLPIEGRVDLHGMTQSEAHALLHSFLFRAHLQGMRHVLVITGKGASFGSEGVLRRAVPQWLATPSFRNLVSSYDAAARRHGGSGAIYVRLRRQ